MMTILATEVLGRTLQQWAIGLGTAGGLWIALVVTRRIVASRLGALAERTDNRWDDVIAVLIRRTRPGILLLLSLWPALQILDAGERTRHVAHILTVIIVTIQLAIWGRVIIDHFLSSRIATLRKDDPETATTLGGVALLARITLWLILLIIALDNLGVDVTTLVAGLGIGGIAIALALQNILGDLFASLSIAMDKPFVVGDFITVGDLAGTVERVGLKTTRIQSISGEQLIISNTDLLGSRVRNFKRMTERRILFTIGVTYDTPYEKLGRIPGMIEKIIRDDPMARFDRAHFARYGDSALTIEVVFYVLSPEYGAYMDVQQRINLAIFEQFTAEGIEFAYPTQTLYLRGGAGVPQDERTA